MKNKIAVLGVVGVLAAGIILGISGKLKDEIKVFANITQESTESLASEIAESTVASEASDEDMTIVIPEGTAKYGTIKVVNHGQSPISLSNNGEDLSVESEVEMDYSDAIAFDELNESIDFSVSGNGFFYGIKGDSVESVLVEPQTGLTISGNDFSYELAVKPTSDDSSISFSGKGSDAITVTREASDVLLSSKLTLGDITVNAGSESYNYQINATRCMIKKDGKITLEDGTEVPTAVDNIAGISKETLAENVFHTIEPALFVKGGSSAVSKAASYINDYVYDDEKDASLLTDDTEIREYYEYYGESGQLSFTITILGSGNHARIATSDGEVHDYLYVPQEGAHCYPVFQLG